MTFLEQMFAEQDETLSRNLNTSPLVQEMFNLLSDQIKLCGEMVDRLNGNNQRRSVSYRLARTCVSQTIAAIRLGLSCKLPESLSLLRTSLEAAVQFGCVADEDGWERFGHELDRKLDKYSFKKCLERLEASRKKKVNELWGKLSNYASHSTASRLALAAGPAQQDTPLAAVFCLHMCLGICQLLLESFRNLAPAQQSQIVELVEEGERLQKKALQELGCSA